MKQNSNLNELYMTTEHMVGNCKTTRCVKMTRAIDSNTVPMQRLIYKFIMEGYVPHPSLLLRYA